MPVENAVNFDELDVNFPDGAEVIKEGDDHLRLFKSVLKNVFPGVNANGFNIPIIATETELNYLQGLTSDIQAQLDAIRLGQVPVGGIVSFAGTITAVPANYSLCDGNNGTPNMIDKFVYGTLLEAELETTGGTADSISISHTHNFIHSHTGDTSLDGVHTHTLTGWTGSFSNFPGSVNNVVTSNFPTASSGDHDHPLTVDNNNLSIPGSGLSGVDQNIPVYVKLAFMQRTV